MIAVVIPALMFTIFSTYFIIEVIFSGLAIQPVIFFDFIMWYLNLVVPVMVAVAIGENTKNEAQKLKNLLGKYSSYCEDASALQKVRI